MRLASFLANFNTPFILHSRYYCCWWPDEARRHAISSPCIALITRNISAAMPEGFDSKFKFILRLLIYTTPHTKLNSTLLTDIWSGSYEGRNPRLYCVNHPTGNGRQISWVGYKWCNSYHPVVGLPGWISQQNSLIDWWIILEYIFMTIRESFQRCWLFVRGIYWSLSKGPEIRSFDVSLLLTYTIG